MDVGDGRERRCYIICNKTYSFNPLPFAAHPATPGQKKSGKNTFQANIV